MCPTDMCSLNLGVADMKEINVRDAREQLSRILKEVERGEEVCILRRGRPVARVVRPAAEPPGVSFPRGPAGEPAGYAGRNCRYGPRTAS